MPSDSKAIYDAAEQALKQRVIQFVSDTPLGAGSYGIVYPGTFDDKDVAIKLSKDSIDVSAIANELERGKKVIWPLTHQHPYINTHYATGVFNVNENGVDSKHLYTVWDKGEKSLKEYMPEDRETLFRLLRMTAYAIDYFHCNKVWHRDIKPANILLFHISDKDRIEARLSDLGTSKFANLHDGATCVGSPAFTHPKQLSDGKNGIVYDLFQFAWTCLVLHHQQCNPGKKITTTPAKIDKENLAFANSILPDISNYEPVVKALTLRGGVSAEEIVNSMFFDLHQTISIVGPYSVRILKPEIEFDGQVMNELGLSDPDLPDLLECLVTRSLGIEGNCPGVLADHTKVIGIYRAKQLTYELERLCGAVLSICKKTRKCLLDIKSTSEIGRNLNALKTLREQLYGHSVLLSNRSVNTEGRWKPYKNQIESLHALLTVSCVNLDKITEDATLKSIDDKLTSYESEVYSLEKSVENARKSTSSLYKKFCQLLS